MAERVIVEKRRKLPGPLGKIPFLQSPTFLANLSLLFKVLFVFGLAPYLIWLIWRH